MHACSGLITSTLSQYRFLSQVAQVISLPEASTRLACLGARMVVMPISPIFIVDNNDSLRSGRCKTPLNIPAHVRPSKEVRTSILPMPIASMVRLSATQMHFGGLIFRYDEK